MKVNNNLVNSQIDELIVILKKNLKNINIDNLKKNLIKNLKNNDFKYEKRLSYFLIKIYMLNHEIDIVKALNIFEEELLEENIDFLFNQIEDSTFPKNKNYIDFTNKICELSLKCLENKKNKNIEQLEKLILDIHKKYGVLDSEKNFLFESLTEKPYGEIHSVLKIKTNDLNTNNLKETNKNLFNAIFNLILENKEKCEKLNIEIDNKITKINNFQVKIGLEIPIFN